MADDWGQFEDIEEREEGKRERRQKRAAPERREDATGSEPSDVTAVAQKEQSSVKSEGVASDCSQQRDAANIDHSGDKKQGERGSEQEEHSDTLEAEAEAEIEVELEVEVEAEVEVGCTTDTDEAIHNPSAGPIRVTEASGSVVEEEEGVPSPAVGEQDKREPESLESVDVPPANLPMARPPLSVTQSDSAMTASSVPPPRHQVKPSLVEEADQSSASELDLNFGLSLGLGLDDPSVPGELGTNFSSPNFGSLEAAHQRIFDSGLTFSEAKGQLWQLRKSGNLMKRGFRFRKMWVMRYVELAGRMLKYFESRPKDVHGAAKPRGRLELTQHTLVEKVPDREGLMFAFNIIPNGDKPEELGSPASIASVAAPGKAGARHRRTSTSFLDRGSGATSTESRMPKFIGWLTGTSDDFPSEDEKVWRFMASSEAERNAWIEMLERAIALIRRVEVAPTLCGVGSVHAHYQLGEVIGRGRFGDVYAAVAKVTRREFAIRAVDKEKRVKTKEDALFLRNEIKIMRRVTRELDHANICKLFQAYEDSAMVYLVMDKLSGGDLYLHCAEHVEALDESFVSSVIRQVAGALAELHGVSIVLCDLRPENLMFAGPNTHVIKVSEFGRAKQLHSHESNRRPSRGSAATVTLAEKRNDAVRRGPLLGMPGFLAPEVIIGADYTPASDIWTLGCILYTLLCGSKPFQGENAQEICHATTRGLQASNLELPEWKQVSSGARLAVGAMLRQVADKRPTAKEILAMEWVTASAAAAPANGSTFPLPEAHKKLISLHERRGPNILPSRVSLPTNTRRMSHGVLSPTSAQYARGGVRGRSMTQARGSPRDLPRAAAPPLASTRGPRLASNWSTPDFAATFGAAAVTSPLRDSHRQSVHERPDTTTAPHPTQRALSSEVDRRAEVLALDVRAEIIRAQFDGDGWGLPNVGAKPGEDMNASFAPAGRFLNDLEKQMRQIREESLAANGGR